MSTATQPAPDDPSVVQAGMVPKVAPEPSPKERLLALDAFRGMTVAAMLLVNDPGSWSNIYPPLEHAEWHGWTPTDLIFPFFLFIVGITTHLSLSSRRARGASERDLIRQIVRRGLLIVAFGLLLNSFPFYMWGTIRDFPDPTFLNRVAYRFEHLRYAGVLQRIGVVYLIAALLTFRTTLRQQIAVLATILLGYWAIMTLIPVPDSGIRGGALLDQPERVLSAWLDRLVIGTNHLWASTRTWDPEGILSTIPAIGTAMLGIFAGRWIRTPRSLNVRIGGLFSAGCLAMLAGRIWHSVFPINKNLWTSSYVLFTAGMAAVILAACLWLIDVLRLRGWAKPFVIFGVNPLIAFVGSGLMARLIYSMIKVPLEGKRVALVTAIYRGILLPWLSPRNASLAFALLFVLFWLGVLSILSRKRIYLRV